MPPVEAKVAQDTPKAEPSRTKDRPKATPLGGAAAADAAPHAGEARAASTATTASASPAPPPPAPPPPKTSPAPAATPAPANPTPPLPAATSALARPVQAAPPATTLANLAEPAAEPVTLATAVFVTGTGRLDPGRRYAIVLHDVRLQFRGPTDLDPSALVLERPIAGIEATAIEGRLLLSEPHIPSGMVLAFMAVAGQGTEALAHAITQAAREAALS